ncbi:GTP pyrophosphokinase [Methanococcus sp. CF]
MDEKQFIEKYCKEMPIFKAWGMYVKKEICNKIKDMPNSENFLKINCEPRLKEIKSIVDKAFNRNKNYKDPYAQIEDKVGVRFVVLLGSDIRKIENIIKSIDIWDYSKDKDFDDERIHKPNVFDYQSVHYVVKNKEPITYEECQIPVDTPCEIQIRTLMQHSYSEVTHDKLYKKNHPNSKLYRNVAKCMALIEVVDDLYMEVDELVSQKEAYYRGFLDKLLPEYIKLLNSDNSKFYEENYSEKLNLLILEELDELISELDVNNVINSIEGRYERYINRSYSENKLYRQPVVLLIYHLLNDRTTKHALKKLWPMTERQLKCFSDDLGISL